MLRSQFKNVVKYVAKQSNLKRSISSVKFESSKSNNNKNFFAASIVSIAATAASYFLFQPNLANDEAATISNRKISVEEFIKHNKADDCWITVNGNVYDLTDFIEMHPGGTTPLIQNAGHDATVLYNKIHPKGTIENFLPKDKQLGVLIGEAPKIEIVLDDKEKERLMLLDHLPSLSRIQNIYDFEYIASRVLSDQAWNYYSCGAEDEITMRENHYAYQRIYFRPRCCVNVQDVDTTHELLGSKASVPFYVSAAASAKLGHDDGECSIARGAGKEGVVQMISSFSSNSLEEIAEARPEGSTQWFQLYVNEDKNVVKKTLKRAENLGMKAIFVTVDAANRGNREKDIRQRITEDHDELDEDHSVRAGSTSGAMPSFIDKRMDWNEIKDIISWTHLPVLVKGVQRHEDIEKAIDIGCQGVVLSNHGGRQLDTSPPPIEVMAESIPILKAKGKLDPNFNIFVDGGVRRGTDILKALAIGGKDCKVAVGLGRPFLYANTGYGEKGVRKAIQILREELKADMRMLGVTSLDELDESCIDTRRLTGRDAINNIYNQNYYPMTPLKFKHE
ncbi:Cytochrome b2, mitochondrial precursor [Pichia californica]|uniref:L-lactate dehydrogenase (cytochrome) n=1 Tax=Pichia californica TaxID=460514 RepID=A0A9P6WLX8_9ASCO|nr:Cytochrome b2, mitochondrial precursor [[Candida] californica]